jgi:hypothetical protein
MILRCSRITAWNRIGLDTVNSRFKADRGLPGGHRAVALVRIGRLTPDADVVSIA